MDVPKMSDTKQVLRAMLQDHVGENNAVTQSQLAEATGLNPSTLRSELRRLREERNIPIANLRNGYFIIRDKSELQAFIGHINDEIESKRNTIEHTLEAWDEFDESEIEIDPEPDTTTPTYECANCGAEITKDERRYIDELDKPICRNCHGSWLMNDKSLP